MIEISQRARERKFFKIKWFAILFLFFLFFITIDLVHVYFHEHAHAAIYDVYNVKYDYGWQFKGAMITFYVSANDTSNCDIVCMSLQMENEIYSYNLAYIYYGLWFIFFLYLMKCFMDDVHDRLRMEEEWKKQSNQEIIK